MSLTHALLRWRCTQIVVATGVPEKLSVFSDTCLEQDTIYKTKISSVVIKMSVETTWNRLRFWCLAGLVLSCYALYVEMRAESDPNYQALCDINPGVSCTAVFTSAYGRGFGLMDNLFDKESDWKPPPNGLLGIGFYLWCLYAIHNDHPVYFLFHMFVCLIVNALSIYLGYLLFYVLEEICVVCLTIYLVNYLILTDSMNYYKLRFHDPATVRTTASHIQNAVNRN